MMRRLVLNLKRLEKGENFNSMDYPLPKLLAPPFVEADWDYCFTHDGVEYYAGCDTNKGLNRAIYAFLKSEEGTNVALGTIHYYLNEEFNVFRIRKLEVFEEFRGKKVGSNLMYALLFFERYALKKGANIDVVAQAEPGKNGLTQEELNAFYTRYGVGIHGKTESKDARENLEKKLETVFHYEKM